MLALVPAAFLVLVLLAALAVDSAVAFQAHEQLHDALIGAANDAVTAGLSQQAFYSDGVVRLDPAAVDAAVCEALGAEDLEPFHGLLVGVSVGADSVEVTASARVDAVFGRAIPGFATRVVSSSAEAVVTDGPLRGPGPALPAPTILDC